MHNWRLLLLLIPSLLQPILSEHNFIDGRKCCIHSSRPSLTDERLLPEKHRFVRSIPEDTHLVDQRPSDQFVIRRFRYDVRDIESTPISTEQHLERNVGDDRSRIVSLKRQRTVEDVHGNIPRQIVREQNHKNLIILKNTGNTATSLYARLSREEKERKSRDNAAYRFDTRLGIRRSHLRHRRQQVSGRIVNSNIVRGNNVITRNFRHDQMLPRQNYRNLNQLMDISTEKEFLDTHLTAHEEDKNIARSFERPIRKRDFVRDSIRDNARSGTSIGHTRERVDIRNTRLNDRIDKRNVERKIRHIRARTVSAERYVTESNTRRITDETVGRNREERNINVRIGQADIKNDENYSRENIRKRSVSDEGHESQLNTKTITDARGVSNPESNSQSDVRYINTHNANRRKESINVRDERINTKNAVRYIRDNQYDARRIIARYLTRTREEPVTNVKHERTYARNIARYSRENTRDRSVSVDQEVRESREVQNANEHIHIRNVERYSTDSLRERAIFNARGIRESNSNRVSLDQSTQSREEVNRNVNDERTFIRTHDRNTNRERVMAAERDVRQQDTRNIKNIHVVYTRSTQNIGRYSSDNINGKSFISERSVRHLNERKMLRSDAFPNHEEYTRNIRRIIRNGERYSNERRVFDGRGIRESNERISNEYLAINRKERNTVRDERMDIRNVERYAKGNTHGRYRDIHDMQTTTDRDLTRSQETRNINVNHDRTDNTNTERYSRDKTRNRSISMNKNVRAIDARRNMDNQKYRSREKRNAVARNKDSDIRNNEKYSRAATRERIVLMSRGEDDRQQITMRIEDRQITRDSEAQNLIVRKERNRVSYTRDERTDERNIHFKGRESREINGRRILRNRKTMDVEDCTYSRKIDANYIDFTNEMTSTTVERNTIYDNRKSNEREIERPPTNDRNGLATHRRERDFVRLSNSRILDSRPLTALRSLTSDLYREKEEDTLKRYRISKKFIDKKRDYGSGRNSEFTAFRTMAQNKAFDSATQANDTNFTELFYWQCLFYAVQGIYILGVLLKVYKEKESPKFRSMGWLPSRLIKVD